MEETTTTTYTTTTTAAYVTTPPVSSPGVGMMLDLSYLRTLSGMVKCIAIVLDFICFICVIAGGPGYYTGAGWSTFVSIVGLIVTLSLLCLYLFHVVDAVPQIPWIVAEMVFCFAWGIFFFIAGCVLAVAAVRFDGAAGWGVAAFFAFGAMCTYGFDCYLKFLSWKNNEVAVGGSGV
uniref:MARVEL domain-containing protein n=1 Tax=Plectus sambesii TaxID=2011161 RepID=A0A914WUS8_9BILA